MRRPGWLGRGLDLRRERLLPDAVAGVTLTALAVPEVLGYARIAGMPVETGLYTMLLPLVAFALFGCSRHLVVGADSATAAILAAGLVGLAVPGSPRYVELAGLVALVVAVLLVIARLVRLSILANFLSRTVLVGFLTGVGIQVAIGQLPEALGLPVAPGSAPEKLWMVLRQLGDVEWPAVLTTVAVVAVVLAARRVDRRIPAALLAVVGAIAVTAAFTLDQHGLAVLGPVPSGLPPLTVPVPSVADLQDVLPVALSMIIVILAQSAATARAYAVRHNEPMNTDGDIVGLAAANLGAAVTGAFVVNGSPTKTQMVDGAGGRSQVAQLTAAVVALLVTLLLAPALSALPLAALAAVVLLIGAELVDVDGMRAIWRARRVEFAVALMTAVAVVVLGVETGIVIAIAASIIDHLRHSYTPHSSVLVKSAAGHWTSQPVVAGARTTDGLVVYRFGSGVYFANASRLAQDVDLLCRHGPPVDWFCLDAAAVGDVDFTAGSVLARVQERLDGNGIRLVLSNVIGPVRAQLDRYGITARVGADAYFETSGEALEEFRARPR